MSAIPESLTSPRPSCSSSIFRDSWRKFSIGSALKNSIKANSTSSEVWYVWKGNDAKGANNKENEVFDFENHINENQVYVEDSNSIEQIVIEDSSEEDEHYKNKMIDENINREDFYSESIRFDEIDNMLENNN